MASKRFTFLNWTKLILHCLKNRIGIYLPIVSVEYVFKGFQWVLKSVHDLWRIAMAFRARSMAFGRFLFFIATLVSACN